MAVVQNLAITSTVILGALAVGILLMLPPTSEPLDLTCPPKALAIVFALLVGIFSSYGVLFLKVDARATNLHPNTAYLNPNPKTSTKTHRYLYLNLL